MRAKDFITEDANVNAANTGDYQRMLSFVKANPLPGVPPDQQISVALFKELEKQRHRNDSLENELDSAEQRIDLATNRTDMYGKQLSRQQAELEREREAGSKQQAAAGELDKQYANRAKASQEQIAALTAGLEDIKSKPGIDQAAAAALEKQIQDLSTKGVGAEKVKELEQHIASVQSMTQVDNGAIGELIAQVNDAKAKAEELGSTRQELSQELAQSNRAAQDEIDQLKRQLAHFREVEKTVAVLNPLVTDVIAPKIDALAKGDAEHDDAIGDLEQAIANLNTAVAGRQAASQGYAKQMVTQPMQRPPQTSGPNPRQIAPALVRSGDLDEGQWAQSIKWATGK